MSLFSKYQSLDNHYNVNLSRFDPEELRNNVFVLQEKLDGSNLSIIFAPDGSVTLGSRNQFLGPWDCTTFQGVNEVLKEEKWQKFIDHFSKVAKNNGYVYYFYGEIFGHGVINRIKYGSKQIRLFDLKLIDENQEEIWISPWLLVNIVETNGFDSAEYLVPILTYVNGIEAAINYNENFPSMILNDPENPAEGFIIRPNNKNLYNCFGERLIIKKKTKAFSEGNVKAEKFDKNKPILSDTMIQYAKNFENYINENRCVSCFSKIGPIMEMKQLGTYIKEVLNDAITDFAKDHNMEEMPKDLRRLVSQNTTPRLVEMLKKLYQN